MRNGSLHSRERYRLMNDVERERTWQLINVQQIWIYIHFISLTDAWNAIAKHAQILSRLVATLRPSQCDDESVWVCIECQSSFSMSKPLVKNDQNLGCMLNSCLNSIVRWSSYILISWFWAERISHVMECSNSEHLNSLELAKTTFSFKNKYVSRFNIKHIRDEVF